MRKNNLIFLAILAMLILINSIWGEERFRTVQLTEKDSPHITDTLDENEVYLREIRGFDSDKNGFLYFLDRHYKTLMKVDMKTLTLKSNISRSGQGPFEFIMPEALRVKNGKIYLLDMGFPGMRIFDLDGKHLKEIRFSNNLRNYQFYVFVDVDNIEVSSKEEFYIPNFDPKTNTAITVLDKKGKMNRNILPVLHNLKNDLQNWARDLRFVFKLDSNDNLIVLYTKWGIVKKFSPQGKLLWEQNLFQFIPKSERNPKDKFQADMNTNGVIARLNFTVDFGNFDILDNNRIAINAYKSLILLNSNDGKIILKINKFEKALGFSKRFLVENKKAWTPYVIFDLSQIIK